jgi:hypothetical protein
MAHAECIFLLEGDLGEGGGHIQQADGVYLCGFIMINLVFKITP